MFLMFIHARRAFDSGSNNPKGLDQLVNRLYGILAFSPPLLGKYESLAYLSIPSVSKR